MSLLDVIFNLLILTMGAAFLQLLLQPRFKNFINIIGFALGSFLFAMGMLQWVLKPNGPVAERILVYICLFLLLSMIFYKGSFLRRIFAVGAFFLANILCEIIGGMVSIIIFGSLTAVFQQSAALKALTMLFYLVLMLLTLSAIYVFTAKEFLKLSKAGKMLCFLFPASQSSIIILVGNCLDGKESVWIYVELALTILVCIASNIGLYKAMQITAEKTKLEEENRQLAEIMQKQYENCAAFNEQYIQTRKLRHDIANHAYTIQTLVAGGHIEEARAYMSEWGNSIQSVLEGSLASETQ